MQKVPIIEQRSFQDTTVPEAPEFLRKSGAR
jgi:hypothetical protein